MHLHVCCLAKEPEVKAWMSIMTGVKTLSELLLRLLPDFWKLAVAFMDGKIQKVGEVLDSGSLPCMW